jgi:GNAT superfamily N-acetyltransferase
VERSAGILATEHPVTPSRPYHREMTYRSFTHAERPDLAESSLWIETAVWPEYNRHSDILGQYWDRLTPEFGDFQFVLVHEATGEVVARGHTVPCSWDGEPESLPEGIDGIAVQAFELNKRDARPNSLSALAIEIPPQHQSKGLGKLMLGVMKDIAATHRLQKLLAPVRPNWKDRYPLAPIERYMHWKREDGLPFDPWIRVHHRLGARIIKPAPKSLRITAPVAEWEARTGLRFPESGSYVFPGCLSPLDIDVEADVGRYWEPNVWMCHSLQLGGQTSQPQQSENLIEQPDKRIRRVRGG